MTSRITCSTCSVRASVTSIREPGGARRLIDELPGIGAREELRADQPCARHGDDEEHRHGTDHHELVVERTLEQPLVAGREALVARG